MIADELIKIEKSKPVTAEMPVMEFGTRNKNDRIYDPESFITLSSSTRSFLHSVVIIDALETYLSGVKDPLYKKCFDAADKLRAEMEDIYSDNEIVARTILGISDTNYFNIKEDK